MTNTKKKIECGCQCHHKHECYFGKSPCVKCGHDCIPSTPEPSEWERELEQILIDWEGKDNAILGAVRVVSRTKTLKQFISTLLAQREKEVQADIYKKLEPVIKDLSATGDVMIKNNLPNAGREMHENIGYMKGILNSLKGEGKDSA